ncbi:MAG: hypothetical protein JWQ32_85 [Marmoricola sp.]|nr:hypothetical protein [Marmoricola sp.]
MNELLTRTDPRVDRVVRICLVIAGLLVLSGLIHLGVFFLDDRPWSGPVSWRKPFDFGLSFGITLASVVWVTSYLQVPAETRTRLLGIFAVDCIVEVAGITLQAWRDQPSHLNTSTPFNTVVAMTLAVGGAVLIAVLGTFAVAALRGRVDGPPSMVLAQRGGFTLLVAGLLSGAAMIARGSIARAHGDAAARMYAVTGFVKEFHGVTLHGVLVLPALAWVLERRDLPEARRVLAVRWALGLYVLAAGLVLMLELV